MYKNKSDQRECYRRWYKKEANRKKTIQKTSAVRKAKWIWFHEYKKDKSCVKCGESDSVCIDLHHPDGRNGAPSPAHLVNKGWSIERMKEELDKCIPICSNCHRKLHK